MAEFDLKIVCFRVMGAGLVQIHFKSKKFWFEYDFIDVWLIGLVRFKVTCYDSVRKSKV